MPQATSAGPVRGNGRCATRNGQVPARDFVATSYMGYYGLLAVAMAQRRPMVAVLRAFSERATALGT